MKLEEKNMTMQIPPDSDIMSWDPENMETYWQQCRSYDTRSIMSVRSSQTLSQLAFNKMLQRFAKHRKNRC